MTNSSKNRRKLGIGKTALRNHTKINFGRVLGSICEGFGPVLGLLWLLLAATWPFFGCSKSNFFQALAQDGLQEGFWMDFGSILEGVWVDFGRIWEGFREIFVHLGMRWGRFGQGFSKIRTNLVRIGAESQNRTPASLHVPKTRLGALKITLDGIFCRCFVDLGRFFKDFQ